jgi:hypothetical protein
VLIDEGQRAARFRIRVRAASGDEHGHHARMSPFEHRLRDAGVVAVKAGEVRLQCGVVAGIPEDERERPLGIARARVARDGIHAQDGHGVIHRAVRRELHPPVGREPRLALSPRQLHRPSRRQCLPHDADQARFEIARICRDRGALIGIQVIRDRQHVVDHRSAMRMARVQEQPRPPQSVSIAARVGDGVGDALRQPEQIDRHQHGQLPAPIFERERLGVQWHGDALRGYRPRGKSRHPHAVARRDIDRRDAGLPARPPHERCPREPRKCRQHGSSVHASA